MTKNIERWGYKDESVLADAIQEARAALARCSHDDSALAKTEADKVELSWWVAELADVLENYSRIKGFETPEIANARAALARCSHDTAGRSYEPGSTLIWGTPTEPRRKLARIDVLCRIYDAGRGIWKQIDENRELLEFLLKEAPELMRRAPFIEAWIGDTDIFLECLVELLELEMPEGALPFPRSWPGTCLHADAVEQSIEDCAERIRRLEQTAENKRRLMQTEEKVLERIDQGETAYGILIETMPGVEARFNRACRNIAALLEDVRKEFPNAQYYTVSGGFHLMLGDTHTFHGKSQQELIALSGSGVSISDGDF